MKPDCPQQPQTAPQEAGNGPSCPSSPLWLSLSADPAQGPQGANSGPVWLDVQTVQDNHGIIAGAINAPVYIFNGFDGLDAGALDLLNVWAALDPVQRARLTLYAHDLRGDGGTNGAPDPAAE